ncbi:MAG: 1-deoxy-D-xylulose-5-phosphate reductoisomerase [Alphaproteobacteria bacterium]
MTSHKSPKAVSILGATGSIGDSTLSVLRQHPDKFRVKGIAAQKNASKLALLAKEFNPEIVVLADETCRSELEERLQGWKGEIAFGHDAVVTLAAEKQDFLVSAISGIAGLNATYAAAKAGNVIGLANKESLVCAGKLLMEAAQQSGSQILPLDSEHSAIFQCLDDNHKKNVQSITLTASGGPFRGKTRADLANVTVKQALAHPNWSMGSKITIDSATLFNKGLEYIEAAHLFDVGSDQLEVLVHPQSIIHSFVTYEDGSTIAQMGFPDMQTPIAVALAHPNRMAIKSNPMNLTTLSFEPVDEVTFKGLRLAKDALNTSAVAPIVYNAANEVAVSHFLAGQISFLKISDLVEEALQYDFGSTLESIEQVWAIDARVRQKTNKLLS